MSIDCPSCGVALTQREARAEACPVCATEFENVSFQRPNSELEGIIFEARRGMRFMPQSRVRIIIDPLKLTLVFENCLTRRRRLFVARSMTVAFDDVRRVYMERGRSKFMRDAPDADLVVETSAGTVRLECNVFGDRTDELAIVLQRIAKETSAPSNRLSLPTREMLAVYCALVAFSVLIGTCLWLVYDFSLQEAAFLILLPSVVFGVRFALQWIFVR